MKVCRRKLCQGKRSSGLIGKPIKVQLDIETNLNLINFSSFPTQTLHCTRKVQCFISSHHFTTVQSIPFPCHLSYFFTFPIFLSTLLPFSTLLLSSLTTVPFSFLLKPQYPFPFFFNHTILFLSSLTTVPFPFLLKPQYPFPFFLNYSTLFLSS